jgi:hypothetical protein
VKRSVSTTIQIILLAPALLCAPFVLMVTPVIFLDWADGTINLIEAVFALSLAISIIAGLLASWKVILSGTNFIREQQMLKTKVQIGLALGTFGGCSVLVWAIKFIVHEGLPRPNAAIIAWSLFLGPSIALLAYQFLTLFKAAGDTRSPSSADKAI